MAETAWLKGDTAVWRGRVVTLEAHQGQTPVRLSNGEIVNVWTDQLRRVAGDHS